MFLSEHRCATYLEKKAQAEYKNLFNSVFSSFWKIVQKLFSTTLSARILYLHNETVTRSQSVVNCDSVRNFRNTIERFTGFSLLLKLEYFTRDIQRDIQVSYRVKIISSRLSRCIYKKVFTEKADLPYRFVNIFPTFLSRRYD